jgi:hypothetical protein
MELRIIGSFGFAVSWAYARHLWSFGSAVIRAYRPSLGVPAVIRWLQQMTINDAAGIMTAERSDGHLSGLMTQRPFNAIRFAALTTDFFRE